MQPLTPPKHAHFELTDQTVDTLFWLGDNIPGGFFIYQEGGRQELIYANRATFRIFGCASLEEFKEQTGFTFRGIVHPDDYDAVQASIEDQIANPANDSLDYVEYRIIRKDGEIRWVDDYGHFAHLGEYGDVYYVFISDITEKRLEHEEHVRAEIALAKEHHVNEMKSSFLFNLSHDIRTPMNAIIGYSELAERSLDDPERLADYLEKTVASSRQLLRLIDDMLEMSRIDNSGVVLDPQPTELRQSMKTVIDLFLLEIEKKQLNLETDIELDGTSVIIDRDGFKRIMSNLIDNAVKFTPVGGTVTVAAKCVETPETGEPHIELRISDTGVGMDQSFMDRMYDAFERERTSTQTGSTGTGLGLAIVRGLLESMGGSIEATSAKGNGTTFTVWFPLVHAQADDAGIEPAGPDKPSDFESKPRRILVVEDIELNRDLVETILEDEGMNVECVENGREAVDAIEDNPAWYFDLVLMDIQMPVMDGYEATRAIRALPREDAQQLPIVALSANARDEDRRMSLESGMNDHIAKPFDADELIRAIYAFTDRS